MLIASQASAGFRSSATDGLALTAQLGAHQDEYDPNQRVGKRC